MEAQTFCCIREKITTRVGCDRLFQLTTKKQNKGSFVRPYFTTFWGVGSVGKQEGCGLQLTGAAAHSLGWVPTARHQHKVMSGDGDVCTWHRPTVPQKKVTSTDASILMNKSSWKGFQLIPNPTLCCQWNPRKLNTRLCKSLFHLFISPPSYLLSAWHVSR